MRNSETSNHIIPQNLHKTTVYKLLKLFKDRSNSIVLCDLNNFYESFVLNRKALNFNTCSRYQYLEDKFCLEDTCSHSFSTNLNFNIPWNKYIEYIGLINNKLLYQII